MMAFHEPEPLAGRGLEREGVDLMDQRDGLVLDSGDGIVIQVGLGNPLKALLCVGAAYFLLGIIVPLSALGPSGLTGFNQTGIINATIGAVILLFVIGLRKR